MHRVDAGRGERRQRDLGTDDGCGEVRAVELVVDVIGNLVTGRVVDRAVGVGDVHQPIACEYVAAAKFASKPSMYSCASAVISMPLPAGALV